MLHALDQGEIRMQAMGERPSNGSFKRACNGSLISENKRACNGSFKN
jgi:hypothetical protein